MLGVGLDKSLIFCRFIFSWLFECVELYNKKQLFAYHF
ncbi:hypothetical protein C4K18_3050 [Pseudomonas chlororaphis subsp. aurantiaca]|nr:hypothetical protein C4K18_3050 [Pseudomonas chlororaphis subsp. aurantiaca]